MTEEIAKLEWQTGFHIHWDENDWRQARRFLSNELITGRRFSDASVDKFNLEVTAEELWGPRG